MLYTVRIYKKTLFDTVCSIKAEIGLLPFEMIGSRVVFTTDGERYIKVFMRKEGAQWIVFARPSRSNEVERAAADRDGFIIAFLDNGLARAMAECEKALSVSHPH